MSRQGHWEDERGVTLVEMVLVVVLMGLVFGIVAFSSWFGVAEGRRVDSATNQLAADLRQAHSRATNRLAPHTVTLSTESSEYTMTGTADPLDLDDCDDADVAEGRCDDADVVVVDADTSVVFSADGSAVVTGANPITVSSSEDPAKYNHTIGINITTSRIQVVP